MSNRENNDTFSLGNASNSRGNSNDHSTVQSKFINITQKSTKDSQNSNNKGYTNIMNNKINKKTLGYSSSVDKIEYINKDKFDDKNVNQKNLNKVNSNIHVNKNAEINLSNNPNTSVKNSLYEALKNINKELNVKIEKKDQSRASLSLLNFLDKEVSDADKLDKIDKEKIEKNEKEDPFLRKMSKKVDLDSVLGNLSNIVNSDDISNNKNQATSAAKVIITESEINTNNTNKSKNNFNNSTNAKNSNGRNNKNQINSNSREQTHESNYNPINTNESNKSRKLNKSLKNENSNLPNNFHKNTLPHQNTVLLKINDPKEKQILETLKQSNIISSIQITSEAEPNSNSVNEFNQLDNLTYSINPSSIDLEKVIKILKSKEIEITNKDKEIKELQLESSLLKKDLDSKNSIVNVFQNKKEENEQEYKSKIRELENNLKVAQTNNLFLEKENAILKTEMSNLIKNKDSMFRKFNNEITDINKLAKEFFDAFISTDVNEDMNDYFHHNINMDEDDNLI